MTQADLWNDICRWTAHVVFVSDGFWAHLAKARDVTWCGAHALDAATVQEFPPCQRCLTLALTESPLDSCLWRWYRSSRGDANAAPSARWCSTCGAAQRAGRCPRCEE